MTVLVEGGLDRQPVIVCGPGTGYTRASATEFKADVLRRCSRDSEMEYAIFDATMVKVHHGQGTEGRLRASHRPRFKSRRHQDLARGDARISCASAL
jgi:hypothetical protein